MKVVKRYPGCVAWLLVTLLTLVLAAISYGQSQGQSAYNVDSLKPAVYDFVNTVRKVKGNIPVYSTVPAQGYGSVNWAQPTYMKPTTVLVWTDTASGLANFRVLTEDPPPVLEGNRARLYTDNVDGTLPVWDRPYLAQYNRWVKYPALEFNDWLRWHDAYLQLWLKKLKWHGVITIADGRINVNPELRRQLIYAGFDGETALPVDRRIDMYNGFWDKSDAEILSGIPNEPIAVDISQFPDSLLRLEEPDYSLPDLEQVRRPGLTVGQLYAVAMVVVLGTVLVVGRLLLGRETRQADGSEDIPYPGSARDRVRRRERIY